MYTQNRIPEGVRGKNFVLFSLSRHNFHSLFLSWGSFRGIFVVSLKSQDPQMCTFGILGLKGLSTKRFDQTVVCLQAVWANRRSGPTRPEVDWAKSVLDQKWSGPEVSLPGPLVSGSGLYCVWCLVFFRVEKIGPKHLKTKFDQNWFGQSRP